MEQTERLEPLEFQRNEIFHLAEATSRVRALGEIRAASRLLDFEWAEPDIWLISSPCAVQEVLRSLILDAIEQTHFSSIRVTIFLEDTPIGSQLVAEIQEAGAIENCRLDPNAVAFEQEHADLTLDPLADTTLPLSQCCRILDVIGGRLQLETQSQSATRTTVRFYVVTLNKAPSGLDTPETQDSQQDRLCDLAVLVADDNQNNQAVLKGLLASQGVDADFVDNRFDALTSTMDRDYDLVLLDIEKSGLNGIEVAQQLRSDETRSKRVPTQIFGTTTFCCEVDYARYREAGMNGLIAKPFSPSQVLSVLRNVARHRLARAAAVSAQAVTAKPTRTARFRDPVIATGSNRLGPV